MENYTGILGIIVLLGIAFLLSNNKTLINKNIIFWGLGLQISFAIIILKTSFGKALFFYFNILIVKLISFADAGSDFLFTSFIPEVGYDQALINFAFRALPVIIFFSSLIAATYHLGIIQIIIKNIAKMISKDIRYLPERKGEAKVTLADIKKIKLVFDWEPKMNLENWIKTFTN